MFDFILKKACEYVHNKFFPRPSRIVLVENSRSTFAPLAWLQDLTEPFITPLSKGCKWNIDVPKLAVKEGLDEIVSERRSTFAGLFTLRVYRKLS